MTRKLLFALIATCTLFTACKKDNVDTIKYTVEGIRDVNANDPASRRMALSVTGNDGVQKQDEVHLSLSGLPDGITASISPEDGIPDFYPFITFYNSSFDTGTYPVQLNCTSKSGTTAYSFNITVPQLNGWTLGGSAHARATYASNTSPDYSTAEFKTVADSVSLVFIFDKDAFPVANSTYMVVATPNGPGKVGILAAVGSDIYLSTDTNEPVTVTVDGSKISFNVPKMNLASVDTKKTLTFSAKVTN